MPASRTIPFTVTNTYGYAYVATNLAGSRVTLTNVFFVTPGATIAGGAVAVTNASGQAFNLSFFALDLDTTGQILPTFATSVTGVLYGNHPNYSVAVTKFSDIVAVVPQIPLDVSFSGGNLTFSWSDASWSLQSAPIVTGPYTTIPGAATGFMTNTLSDQMYFRLFHP